MTDFQRVYFYHIRKCAGQSIYHAVLENLCPGVTSVRTENLLSRAQIMVCDDKLIVGWSAREIDRGDYDFAFSHYPMHELKPMPNTTFTFTCFREPSERVISHYRMLRGFCQTKQRRDVLRAERRWVRKSFSAFLDNLPQNHLMAQLWAFSPSYNPDEALKNVAKLSYWFTVDDFSAGLAELGRRIGMDLEEKRVRPSSFEFDATDDDLARLREMLEPEYKLWDGLKELGA